MTDVEFDDECKIRWCVLTEGWGSSLWSDVIWVAVIRTGSLEKYPSEHVVSKIVIVS